jgi:pantothenate kinase
VLFRTLDAVVAHLESTPAPGRRIIGIAGEPGAGKSTIAAAIASALGAALLPMDGYHLPQAELERLGRRDRMGAPDTFDVEAFVQTLTAVRERRAPVLAPSFDRDIEEAVPDAIAIGAQTETVIVEGNYLLLDTAEWSRVADLLDEVYFVDLGHDIRVQRLIERHVQFGKTEPEAREWALGPDEVNARLIAATARRAEHTIRLD